MPILRELWVWALFTVLALLSLGVVTYREIALRTGDGAWDTIVAIGRDVQPLWVASAIAVYTITEGWTMLAEAFKKKLREYDLQKGMQKGREEERAAIFRIIEANPGRAFTAEELRKLVDEQKNGAQS